MATRRWTPTPPSGLPRADQSCRRRWWRWSWLQRIARAKVAFMAARAMSRHRMRRLEVQGPSITFPPVPASSPRTCLLDHQPSTSGRCCRNCYRMNSDLHTCLSTAGSKLGSRRFIPSIMFPTSPAHQIEVQALCPMPKLGLPHSWAALMAERKFWMWLKLSSNHEAVCPE